MSIDERSKLIHELFAECLEISEAKGKDYSGTEDALANFKRGAERLGMTPFQVWAVYFSKHIDSVMNSIKVNPKYPQVESEPIRGRIIDIIVYATCLEALMQDEKGRND